MVSWCVHWWHSRFKVCIMYILVWPHFSCTLLFILQSLRLKSVKIWLSKWIYYVKNHLNLSGGFFQLGIIVFVKIFFITSIFETLYFLKSCPIFVKLFFKPECVCVQPNFCAASETESLSSLVHHLIILFQVSSLQSEASLLTCLQ